MKRIGLVLAAIIVICSSALAVPLATAARSVIPKEAQQIICVDYRTLKASPTALALKERVLPPNMKSFEEALRGLGLDPDKDVETLAFASFRPPGGGLQMIGIAQGQFAKQQILKRFKTRKVRPTKYRSSFLYPVSGGTQMAFLDDFTLLFGDNAAIRSALDARDGEAESLTSNSQMSNLISDADNGPVWSVLDAAGTQNMMKSALGDAAQLADYEMVKKRLLGSRYAMDFSSGVKFDLDVVTSDSMTASALSSLVKAGMMYRKMTSSGTEKVALESMSVDSESDRLRVHFSTDDKKFQSLMNSDLFAAVSR
ncbi:MAG: hypothetical protein ACE14L_04935 [Terriglobales bacterium]